jgi:hypothetical protein
MATQKVTQKVTTWDTIQGHHIAKGLDAEVQLALLCEYTDLKDELEGMTLSGYIDAYFATGAGDPEPEPEAEAEEGPAEPSDNGDVATDEPVTRPANMVGMQAVYRFPGQSILTDENGITRDSNGTVAFTDVAGEPWTNIKREHVFPIDPANYYEIHVPKREVKEITSWLAGNPSPDQADGDVLRNFTIEFPKIPDRIVIAIVNGKRPYVDRFVQLPENNFEDDQKPTTRFLGKHCFRVRKKDYVVEVVTP